MGHLHLTQGLPRREQTEREAGRPQATIPVFPAYRHLLSPGLCSHEASIVASDKGL